MMSVIVVGDDGQSYKLLSVWRKQGNKNRDIRPSYFLWNPHKSIRMSFLAPSGVLQDLPGNSVDDSRGGGELRGGEGRLIKCSERTCASCFRGREGGVR